MLQEKVADVRVLQRESVEYTHEAMVALCTKLGDLTTLEDYETDDDESMRQSIHQGDNLV